MLDASDPDPDHKKLKKEFESTFMKYYSGLEKAAKSLGKSNLSEKDDMSARSALQHYGGVQPPQTRVENLVEQLCVDFELMDHADRISAFNMLIDSETSSKYGDAELNVHDQRGLSVILLNIYKDLTEF